MRLTVVMPGTILLLVGAFDSLHAAEKGWVDLFNGKDLTGWRANADPGAFTVRDGVLVAHATHPTNRGHLFTTTPTDKPGPAPLRLFKNFELEAVTRGEPNSNSGIFFHTDTATRDGVLHLANGYEVQLNHGTRNKKKTGSLYDVVDLTENIIEDQSRWFRVRLRVQGMRIRVWLNDQQVVDYTQPAKPERSANRAGRLLRPEGGAIALQAHDDESTFYFRSIRVRELK
ncbi:MAG: 3-keto-disaccharide hydrolase [Planctomycetota bacterium]|jgi:hypothetical protein